MSPIRFLAKSRSQPSESALRLSFRAAPESATPRQSFVFVSEWQSNRSRRRVPRRCPQTTRSPVQTPQRQDASPHRVPRPLLPFRPFQAKPHLPTHYVLAPLYFLEDTELERRPQSRAVKKRRARMIRALLERKSRSFEIRISWLQEPKREFSRAVALCDRRAR